MTTILITGANRGLGLEMVWQYANADCDVIATCRHAHQAEELQRIASGHSKVRIEELEVTDAASIAALVKRLDGTPIDILINNAGIISGHRDSRDWSYNDIDQSFGTLNDKTWAQVLYVNAIAPMMVTQALLPLIKTGKERKIAMISSVYGSITEMTEAGHTAYRSSKAALNSAMRNAAIALKPEGIIVVSLHPGWVKTDMGGQDADISAPESIEGLRRVIADLTLEQSGGFFDYQGNTLPW